VLDIPVGTVRSRLHHAVLRLRQVLIHRSPMKTETLGSLVDRPSAGCAFARVAELLENYLIQNSDAAQQANILASTVQLARTAAAGPNASTSPLPPLERVRKALTVQRRQAFAWQLSKLAACMLLGLTIGLVSRFAETLLVDRMHPRPWSVAGHQRCRQRCREPETGSGLWRISHRENRNMRPLASAWTAGTGCVGTHQ